MDDTLLTVYPYNVIYDIYQDKDFVYEVYIPAFLETIEDMPSRYRLVIEMRYRDKMTYKAIGERFGVTGSRIGQIREKALRKLRHPSRSRGYILGKDPINRLENLLTAYKEATAENESLKKIIKFKNQSGLTPASFDVTIEELELSVRTFNALKRANIKTLADLMQLSGDDLRKLRGMGRKSFDELNDKVDKYNLVFA